MIKTRNLKGACFAAVFAAALLLAVGIGNVNFATATHHLAGEQAKVKKGGLKAQCILRHTKGNTAKGVVTFTELEEGVLIEAKITGLDKNAKHGFHIHQYGDISAQDGTATGGHFNPHEKDHAGPDKAEHHVGDLGNIESDGDGVGTYRRIVKHTMLVGKNGIVGRGMIVHAGTDDLKSQPTGAAGGRIAQGVIAIIKSGG